MNCTVLECGFHREKLNFWLLGYGSACKTNLGKLDVLNNQCLRKVTGCTKTTPINTLYAIAAQSPLEFRRKCSAGRQLAKHYYRDSVVKYQLDDMQDDQERNRYTFIEQVALDHSWIFHVMSSSFVGKRHWDEVHIETDLPDGLWRKRVTNDRVFKQLTLSLIHGKYKGQHIIYTDASRDQECCGIGVFHEASGFRLSLKLQNYVCIMSAELEAICVALQYIERSGLTNAVIMTDSKSGLEFIKLNIENRFRDEIVEDILTMAAGTRTSLQWIPAHVGTYGNEIADQLAKAGMKQTEQLKICSNKMFIHDVDNYFYRLEDNDAQQWYLEYAAVSGKGRRYFQFQNTIPAKPWYHKKQLTNFETRTLNRLLAGHDYSSYWLFKMRIQPDCICEICDVVENAEHIIFFCVKYAQTRRKYELDNYCNIYQVFETNNTTLIRNVVAFLKEIDKHI